jgi:hypothetical protein
MRAKRTYLLIAAALALVAGCATPPPKPPGPLPTVQAKFERRLADGRLTVAANLRNASPGPEEARVLCTFQDGDGKPVPGPAPLAVTLAAGEILTVHFDAATIAAAEALVTVGP